MKLGKAHVVSITVLLACTAFLVLVGQSDTYVDLPPLIPGLGRLSFMKAPIHKNTQARSLPSSWPEQLKVKSPAHVVTANVGGTGVVRLVLQMDNYPAQRANSCSGHAVGQVLRYAMWRRKCATRAQCLKYNPQRPCPYFIWFLMRCQGAMVISGPTCYINTGPTDFDRGLGKVKEFGFINEGEWKGIESHPEPWTQTPASTLFKKSKKHNRNFITQRLYVNEFWKILEAGNAILIGITVGSEYLKTDWKHIGGMYVPVIRPLTGNVIGGHALVVVGAIRYNGQTYFQIQNSWGKDWVTGFMEYNDLVTRTGGPIWACGFVVCYT